MIKFVIWENSYGVRENKIEGYIRIVGLSGVRALPLAAGINEGGHYFMYWSERVACARRAT